MKVPILLSVNITAEDIDSGRRKSCELCPAALAIMRDYPDTKRVSVGVSHLFIDALEDNSGKVKRAYYKTSRRLKAWILRFDNYGTDEDRTGRKPVPTNFKAKFDHLYD